MFTAGKPASRRILAVRLGAMGDIIHTLHTARLRIEIGDRDRAITALLATLRAGRPQPSL